MRWQSRDAVLAVCTLALFVTVFGRLAISPVVPEISETFEVSNGRIGLALSGMWLAYALTQFPSGVLADRYGDRPVILLSIGGTAAATLAIVAAPAFGVFLLGTVLLGALAGLHYSVATTLITRLYDDIGTAIGIHNGGAPLAGLVAPVVVAWAVVRYGWRVAVGLTVLVAVPTLLLAIRGIRTREPRTPDRPMRDVFAIGPIRRLLSRPPVLFTGAIAVLTEFTWQSLASFLPTFLVRYHGHSTTLAGTLFGVYFLTQGILQIGVGRLADRFGRDPAIGGCMAAGIAGIALLIAATGLPAIVVGCLLLGLGMSWGAAVFPRFIDRLTPAERSFGFGLFRTTYMTIAASGSVVVGVLADLFGWGVSVGSLAGLLAVVGLLLAGNAALGSGY
ncbi:MFS transporter [Halopenitus persicus]|uniref:Predicted arabinose efflux permease, MFS family n=1 Tax=Halopenitus persicus TaxID=1048396 RepID=A0A1H3EU44_9EURY|nr:MFS transporter [Halopenitus persicus]SDX82302.1 Predicted arabinose efflux permease, MFS family [Halopenitus persicus]